MENKSLFKQFKRRATLKSMGIVLFGIAAFVILFYLQYTHGFRHGDLLRSIIYSIPLPLTLTMSLLYFSFGDDRTQKMPAPWYRRRSSLFGVLFLALAILCLILPLNSLLNNNLPDLAAYLLEGVSLLLLLFICAGLIQLRRSSQVEKKTPTDGTV